MLRSSVKPPLAAGVSASSCAKNTLSSRLLHADSNRPASPPQNASTRLSVSRWRIMRPRLAPNASRTPISRCRAVARGNQVRLHGERNPELCEGIVHGGTGEALRRYADDGICGVEDPNGTPQNSRVTLKSALPKRAADYHNRAGAGSAVFVRQEGAAQLRSDAQTVEVVGGDQLADDLL